MAEFYIESRVDDFNIWSKTVLAVDVGDAIAAVYFIVPPAYRVRQIKIVNRDTWEKHCVLTLRCPKCRTPVLDCEEWMLSGVTNVYQHVDCYSPQR